ncbi:hypothetical protein CWC22_014595 [Pseudoalteromonas rubra]|uniref:KfrA N-terminal DNA-binding domain-containing protein n=1 Tax=Pseudoalteromonas rubra TaxID=43658 RepID=A0A5S3UW35_9GAMM|nr:hypothetical protein [Pseudoalteromonas rubra]QPB84150.1 hypothetical protein CWC22_014595 [Pseudoalteromonas rubra]
MHPAVLNAIAALVAQGKTPTVATTKAKLAEPVAMPLIIAGLTAYKNNPDLLSTLDDQPTQNAQPAAQDNAQTQLDRIEAKLDKLLALLESR